EEDYAADRLLHDAARAVTVGGRSQQLVTRVAQRHDGAIPCRHTSPPTGSTRSRTERAGTARAPLDDARDAELLSHVRPSSEITARHESSPMSIVGVVIIGVNGAVATTLIAGVELMIRGLAPRLGMVTERTDARVTELTTLLDFAPLEDLVFAGWDVRYANVYEGAVHHKVLPHEQLEQVKDKLTAITPWPAGFAKRYAEKGIGAHVGNVKSDR